ncbi:hypothetical protein BS78_09G111800 [Paspalum vaginatum]|nr:hypothetical protein BS78_09G111800 [Paspalum vaginatum]
MALRLGGGRRRWSCQATRRGKGGAGGCHHFHVHYHSPRQVWAFSPLRLPPIFTLLPYLLVLPVLFLAMLSFLVCFGWFTLVYFVSSLWSQSMNPAGDSGEPRREHEPEERALNLGTEHDDGSYLSEVCVQGQEIKNVFEDGFSGESRNMSRGASTGICINDHELADDENILTEVMVVEKHGRRLKAFADLDGSPEKHQQIMAIPIDCFHETCNNNDSTSLDTARLLDVPHGEEFDADRKEITVLSSPEIFEFIDRHDTAETMINGAGNDFVIPEVSVSSSDDSAHHGLEDEHVKEISQEQSTPEFSVSSVAEWLPEDVVDEWHETQNLLAEHNDNLPEAASNDKYGKKIVDLSDEARDSVCELAGLPLCSVCGNISESVAVTNTLFKQEKCYQDRELQEELIQNKKVGSSISASVCGFANNHRRILEELDGFTNEENIRKGRSPDTSVLGTAEDEGIVDTHASMGAPRRLPLVRRSPAPWWNLCGVLDVFARDEEN